MNRPIPIVSSTPHTTTTIINSFTAKYRDLTWKQEGISGAKAGMLAFMGVGTGDVNHVGMVTERGTVVHSSKRPRHAVFQLPEHPARAARLADDVHPRPVLRLGDDF